MSFGLVLVQHSYMNSTNDNPDLGDASLQPNPKLSAEDENIDSFDVNPKSGRWSVTDTITDDYIIDSNLRLISSTNDSSSPSQYFGQRGLTKSDGKYEYRYKTSYGDNTSEYFRDQKGDSVDFEESDYEGATQGTGTYTSSNGYATFTGSTVQTPGLYWTFTFNQFVYTTLEYDIKTNDSSSTRLIFYYTDLITKCYDSGYTITTTTSWETKTVDISSVCSQESIGRIFIIGASAVGSDYSLTYLDNVKLTGSYDYATHSEGDVEDTWDWQDSNEYFYTSYGNVSDFNDGTTENWTLSGVGSIANSGSEYLYSSITGSSTFSFIRTGLSITASTYSFLTFEYNSSLEIDEIEIFDSGSNSVCDQTTNRAKDTWHLFTCDLSLDPDWTGTETEIKITITVTPILTASYQFINMIYLYDTNLGDLENFNNGLSSSFQYSYVQPEGYLSFVRFATSSSPYMYSSGLNIDSSLFYNLEFRVKSDSAQTFEVRIGSTVICTLSSLSTFQTKTCDVSGESVWTGTISQINFVNSGGTNNVHVVIDYILLTSSSQETDIFSLGLYDQDNSQPLLNVTEHFWNSTYFQWRVYLTDSQNDIVSYYYSSNRTYSDEYFRVKLSYDVLRSDISVEVKDDTDVRIFRANYPDDFTQTDIPQLFIHGKSPDIYFSSYTPYITSSEIWVDFLEAPFEEREWFHKTTPSSSEWQIDSPLSTRVGNDTSAGDSSVWQNAIPFLDGVSGTFGTNVSNNNAAYDGTDHFGAHSYFRVYAVNKFTGALTELIEISVEFDDNAPGNNLFAQITISIAGTQITETGSYLSRTSSSTWGSFKPGFEFSVGTIEDRSKLTSSIVMYENIEDQSQFSIGYTANVTVSEFESDFGQEFIIETEYYIDDDLNDQFTWSAGYSAFQWAKKDLLGDIGNFAGGLVGGGIDFFGSLFTGFISTIVSILNSFILPLFLWIGSVVAAAAISLYNLLSPVLDAIATTINSVLGPLISAVSDAVNGLVSWLSDIVDQVIALGSAIIDYLITIMTDVLDAISTYAGQFISDVIDVFLPFVLGIWDTIVETVLGWIDPSGNFYSFITNIVSSFSDAVTAVISLFSFIGSPTVFAWIVIAMVFILCTLPAWSNRDRHGNVNMPAYLADTGRYAMAHINTPFIWIPFIILVYVLVKILTAQGVFQDLFGSLPF